MTARLKQTIFYSVPQLGALAACVVSHTQATGLHEAGATDHLREATRLHRFARFGVSNMPVAGTVQPNAARLRRLVFLSFFLVCRPALQFVFSWLFFR